jgi:hypothetical protein
MALFVVTAEFIIEAENADDADEAAFGLLMDAGADNIGIQDVREYLR